jgi:hypothetical protein
MSKRTKVILWLTLLPFVPVVGGLVWIAMYSHLPRPESQASYFVIFHFQLLRVFLTATIIFACGLISLVFDRRKAQRK